MLSLFKLPEQNKSCLRVWITSLQFTHSKCVFACVCVCVSVGEREREEFVECIVLISLCLCEYMPNIAHGE